MDTIFLSVKEFALHVKMHPNTIYRAIKNGRINAFKIGQGNRSVYRIPTSETLRLAEKNMKEVMDNIFKIHAKKVGLM